MEQIKLEFTCSHVTDACREELSGDPNQPTLASCLGCASVMFKNASVLENLLNHEILPVSPGTTLGQALFGTDLIGEDRFNLGLEAVRTPDTGMLAMLVNGLPGVSVYAVRRTVDGMTLIFPGSSHRWADRVVNHNDVFWFFGDTIIDERVVRGETTIFNLLREALENGKLVLNVRSLARVG